MMLRVSDGYSAAVEFQADNAVQFAERCAAAISEFHGAKIPAYQTRKMQEAFAFHRLQLHAKTALDCTPRSWRLVAHVNGASPWRDAERLWGYVRSHAGARRETGEFSRRGHG